MNLVGLCLAAYLTGLLTAQYLDLPILQLVLGSCLLLIFLLSQRKSCLTLPCLLLFCLLIGLVRYPVQLKASTDSDLVALLTQGPLRIEGLVLSTEERPEQGRVVDLEVLNLEAGAFQVDPGLRLRLFIASSGVVLPVGSRIAFSSRVRSTRNFGIPGEFNYVRNLAERQIWFTAYLPDDRGLAFFAGRSGSLSAAVDRLRQAGLRFLEESLSPQEAMLLKGLLLGEKGGMSSALRQQLAAGGISHLFAISGLHLGLLALFLFVLFRFLYSRSTQLLLWQPASRVLWPLILPLLFIYLLLTGEALATQRAFYLLFFSSLLLLLRRRTDPLALLMTLAFLFLLIDPLALWQPSFLLSFSGVFGILCWHGRVKLLLRRWPVMLRASLQLLFISFAAFVATLPVVVLIFHLFAPAAVLTNLLAIPLVSLLALPAGLLGLALSLFLPQFGLPLLHVSAWTLQLLISLVSWVAELPPFLSRPLFPTLLESLAIFLGCLGFLVAWRRPACLLLLLPALYLYYSPPEIPTGAEATLFSVGQGESMLLQVDGKNILIDGGGLRSSRFEVGERLLAPALGRLGVRSLDAIILSHNHPDHSDGLRYIVHNFAIGEFWSPLEPGDLELGLYQALVTKGVEIHQFSDSIWREQGVAGVDGISLFLPPVTAGGQNNQSLCLYLKSSAGGLLLTGDLEAEGVSALNSSQIPGPVAVLKAPHHGSAGSKPEELLKRFLPRVVLVSVGYQNPYHFPSTRLLQAAEDLGAEVRRTDLEGSLRVRFGDKDLHIACWRKGVFR